MKILEEISELDVFLPKIKEKNSEIAIIPTMGSIHKGHLSLVKKSKKLGFYSIVTIFINPTQFNDSDDYNQYPRSRDLDIKYLKENETDLLFFPSMKDIYPKEIKSEKTILNYRNILCDTFRPGHFDGVTTVVSSLFNIIKPNHSFFGEKDYQQLKLIQKIIEKNKLPITLHPCSSIRMPNGMSFSSRYKKFTLSQELFFDQIANQILKIVEQLKKKVDIVFIKTLESKLKKIGIIRIDYIEVRDDINLLPIKINKNARLFLSFYVDDIRIIDNFILY